MAKSKKVETEWSGQTRLLPGPKLIESEKSVLDAIRTAVVAAGCICMRNNVGATKAAGRFIRWGLGKGSADLICVVPPHGRFLGIEVKRPKKSETTPDQLVWAEGIRRYGGVAGVAKNVGEAMLLVAEAKRLP